MTYYGWQDMPRSERQFWMIFSLLIAAMTVVGVALIMTVGNHPERCAAPRHWVPVYCSKGCIYDCR